MTVSYNSTTKKWSFNPQQKQALKTVNYPGRYYINYKKTKVRIPNPKMGSGYRTVERFIPSLSTTPDPNADITKTLPFPGEEGFETFMNTEWFKSEYFIAQEYAKKIPDIKIKAIFGREYTSKGKADFIIAKSSEKI